MEPVVDVDSLLLAFDVLGLFAFAASGALLAIERGFDLVGIVLLAVLTAVGGGIIRDLVLGDTPPDAFVNVWYLLTPVGAAAVAFFGHQLLAPSPTGHLDLRRGGPRTVHRHGHTEGACVRVESCVGDRARCPECRGKRTHPGRDRS